MEEEDKIGLKKMVAKGFQEEQKSLCFYIIRKYASLFKKKPKSTIIKNTK